LGEKAGGYCICGYDVGSPGTEHGVVIIKSRAAYPRLGTWARPRWDRRTERRCLAKSILAWGLTVIVRIRSGAPYGRVNCPSLC